MFENHRVPLAGPASYPVPRPGAKEYGLRGSTGLTANANRLTIRAK
jgi:hypothetical protein